MGSSKLPIISSPRRLSRGILGRDKRPKACCALNKSEYRAFVWTHFRIGTRILMIEDASTLIGKHGMHGMQ